MLHISTPTQTGGEASNGHDTTATAGAAAATATAAATLFSPSA